MHSDVEHLAHRLSRGDEHAYRELIGALGEPLFRYAFSILRDPDAAEDAVQTCLIRLYKSRKRLREGSLKAYAYRITRNVARTRVRDSVLRSKREHESGSDGAHDSPELAVMAREAWNLAQQLPGDIRDAVLLHVGHGLTLNEAAEVLDVPRGTVSTRVRRGLEELRGKLAITPAIVPALGDFQGAMASTQATPVSPPSALLTRLETTLMATVTAKATSTGIVLAACCLLLILVVAAVIAITDPFEWTSNASSSNHLGLEDPVIAVNESPVDDDVPADEAAEASPPAMLYGWEFTEEEALRFQNARPRRLTDPPTKDAIARALGWVERTAEEQREYEREQRLERLRKLEAGPWKYPIQLEAERPAGVQTLKELQEREGYFHPDGINMMRPSTQSDSAEQPREVDPATDCVFTTAMALLALTRAGRNHKEGGWRSTSMQAVMWARKIQDTDGHFGYPATEDPIIHHAAATLAISEAYRATGDAVLMPIADKALIKLYELRNDDGGWGAAPGTESNVLATGFALLALASAADWHTGFEAQVTINEVLQGIAYWLWNLRDTESTRWSAGSLESPDGLPSGLLADAVFVIGMHWGQYWTLGDYSVERALHRLREQSTEWSSCDPMTRFFTSIALWTVDPDRSVQWSLDTIKAIDSAAEKRGEGQSYGPWISWSSQDAYTTRFGKAFCTAASIFVLYQCRSFLPSIEIGDSSGVLQDKHVSVLDANGEPIGRVVQMHVDPDEYGSATSVLVTDLPGGTIRVVVTIDNRTVLSKAIETKVDEDLNIQLNR